MSLNKDDLRAGIAAGMITEAQAASILALSEARQGQRQNITGLDEPFELFRGFNEIFIVVGLTILYAGWMGLTGFSTVIALGPAGPKGFTTAFYALITLGACVILALYFTRERRMIAPSIALTVMFALAALQLGASVSWSWGMGSNERAVFTCGLATLLLIAWYWMFRVPFSMALVAVGVFLTAGSALVLRGATIPSMQEIFLLSAEGPFAWLTIILGLIGLGVALTYDMSDPHRVTRRAQTGFWLHVIAAPAIVSTVALTLLTQDTAQSQLLLVLFLTLLAFFAIVIDRRSFLVAGVGYVVALSFVVLEGSAMLAILLLGLGLVLLGAKWEAIRSSLLRALPSFPGKTRLPPWDTEALIE